MFAEKCVCFSRAGIFCPAGAEGRAAPPRNGSARRPNVRVCPPSRGRLCRRGKVLRARTGFSAAEAGRRLCPPRTEIYCENGNLLQKHGGVFRVSYSCRLCAVRFARTRRRWAVRGAVGRISAARTWLRSARESGRGRRGKNHKRISTAFQPLRRRRQSKSESPSNRIGVCIPIHGSIISGKSFAPAARKCTRTLCGFAISTKSRVLPCRRHGKIV